MSLDAIRLGSVESGSLSAFNRAVAFDAANLPAIIADLLHDAREAAREDRFRAECRVQEAVDLIKQEGDRLLELTRPAPVRGGLAPWQMRRIDGYIREHLETGLRVSVLASIAKLSASHFSRAFAQSYGRCPREHVAALRLERARSMMLETGDPLCQIAAACGFADQAHLSTRFRKAYGTSPHAWRRQNIAESSARDGNAFAVVAFA